MLNRHLRPQTELGQFVLSDGGRGGGGDGLFPPSDTKIWNLERGGGGAG